MAVTSFDRYRKSNQVITGGGGSFRYWRINTTALNNGWPSIHIGEVEWRTAVGGAKTNPNSVTSPVAQYQTNSPSLVNDGDLNTGWATDGSLYGALPAALVFDFGTPVTFAELAIAPYSDVTYAPKDFTVDVSDDGVNWVTMTPFSGVASTAYTLNTFTTFQLDSRPTAKSTAAGGAVTSRMISGLTYFEAVADTFTGTPSIGIVPSNWNTSTALQSSPTTLGYLPTGAVQINGVTLATIATWASGDSIDCAVDPSKMLIWFRVNGGNWNNNASADPATGAGGIDISSLPWATMQAAIFASAANTIWRGLFSPQWMKRAQPAGYAAMDTVGFTVFKSTEHDVMAGSAPASYSLTTAPNATTRGKHFSPAGPVTVVSGTTKENGVAVTGRRVDVYDRHTGELIGTTNSDGSGNWSIPCLGRPSVRIVGSDPTAYNSQVYDDVTPA